jgi:hypothetical protein
VVERDVRLDASIEQAVDDAIVVVDTGGVDAPNPPGTSRDQLSDMR